MHSVFGSILRGSSACHVETADSIACYPTNLPLARPQAVMVSRGQAINSEPWLLQRNRRIKDEWIICMAYFI